MTRTGRAVWAAAVLACVLPATARADGATIAAGKVIVANGVTPERPGCSSCHLQNGAGQPDVAVPRLAGLTSSYIVAQLAYFASGARHDTVMTPYAVALTAGQRQQVADYFASLATPEQVDVPAVAPAQIDRGRSLFLNGDYRTGLLSCSQCHGPTGLGVGDFSPALAGQSAPYVRDELRQWRAGALRDPQGAFMLAETRHLTRADIEAVAAYVALLRTGGTSKP